MRKANKTSSQPLPPLPPRWVTWFQHAAPAAVFLVYLVLWQASPELIPRLAQEDSWVEWLTVAMFGSASAAFALIGMKRGLRTGWFAWGLALFCFVVAGEEISWGQRLIGFVPPEVFLQKNYQVEANFHNLFNEQMGPKWMIVFVLVGWGLLLPVLRKIGAEKLFERFGVIEPPLMLAPWFILNLILLQEYPAEMTAEYNELITGALFLATAIPMLELGSRTYVTVLAPTIAVVVAASYLNLQHASSSPEKLACAESETKALTAAIEAGAALPALFTKRSMDFRVYTMTQRGYLKPDIFEALDAVACDGVSTDPNRRRFALDPWGQPYWIYSELSGDRNSVFALFYSFGPNRRYDSPRGSIEGTDDIGARSRPLNRKTGLAD